MAARIRLQTIHVTEFTGKVAPVLTRYLQRRCNITVAEGNDPVDAVIILEDWLPEGHKAGSEGFAITTKIRNGIRQYTITGETLGLLYGAGRFIREVLRDGEGGICWPELQLNEQPVLPLRGIYFPMQLLKKGEKYHAFNAYSAWLHYEDRFEDFEEALVELMLWGMNTIGIWYAEWMPAPGDGPLGKRQGRVYSKVVVIARSWRLRVCLLTTANVLPPFSEDHPLEQYRSANIPDGLWAKFNSLDSYCPQVPALRRMIRDYRDKLIQTFRPDWVEVFPTDPGGCECERCKPWWKNYLELAREILAPWVDRVPLRGINFWYFWNRDAVNLAENLGDDGVFNIISTQGAWKESTAERLRISDRLARKGTRIVFWPDITMVGSWGQFGTFPIPNQLGSLFRLAKEQPYGVLPYTEGRYDDFNKFAMLSLAWNPKQDAAALTRRVLVGMFGQQMPDEAVKAVTILEQGHSGKADTLFAVAANQLDDKTLADWRWYALHFYAHHSQLDAASQRLLRELEQLRERQNGQPLPASERRRLRRKLAQVERLFAAYQAELPELYRQVNDFRRWHHLFCGTTLPAAKELRRRCRINEITALLRELSGHGKAAVAEVDLATALNLHESG